MRGVANVTFISFPNFEVDPQYCIDCTFNTLSQKSSQLTTGSNVEKVAIHS